MVLLASREKVGELLSQVCSGVGQEEMAAALQGLLAAAAHVRAAAITAMLDVPAFAEGAHAIHFAVVTVVWVPGVLASASVMEASHCSSTRFNSSGVFHCCIRNGLHHCH